MTQRRCRTAIVAMALLVLAAHGPDAVAQTHAAGDDGKPRLMSRFLEQLPWKRRREAPPREEAPALPPGEPSSPSGSSLPATVPPAAAEDLERLPARAPHDTSEAVEAPRAKTTPPKTSPRRRSSASAPTGKRSAPAIELSVPLPPPPVFAKPPELVALPGSVVYAVVDRDDDIFFVDGSWWRPWQEHWFRSHYHDRDWGYFPGIPAFAHHIPPDWRTLVQRSEWNGRAWHYERIPYQLVRKNWLAWNRERHWDWNPLQRSMLQEAAARRAALASTPADPAAGEATAPTAMPATAEASTPPAMSASSDAMPAREDPSRRPADGAARSEPAPQAARAAAPAPAPKVVVSTRGADRPPASAPAPAAGRTAALPDTASAR